jgi:hypothetical protein
MSDVIQSNAEDEPVVALISVAWESSTNAKVFLSALHPPPSCRDSSVDFLCQPIRNPPHPKLSKVIRLEADTATLAFAGRRAMIHNPTTAFDGDHHGVVTLSRSMSVRIRAMTLILSF